MDDASSTSSILDTLRTVEFRLGLKGYNVDEVDEYLEKAAMEAEQVQERLRAANERLRLATERAAQLEEELQRSPAERPLTLQPDGADAPPASVTAGPGAEESVVTNEALQRTFFLAQKFVEQTKRESEAEAAEVVSRAEERAREVVTQAEDRARKLRSEAEDRLRDEVARLEEARERLSSDVEAMTQHLEDQRTKIRESLTEVLRWVDERMPAVAASADAPDGGGADAAGREPSARGSAGVSPPDPADPAARAGTGDAGPAGSEEAEPQAGHVSGAVVGAGAGRTRPQGASKHSGAPERSSAAPARSQAPAGARAGVLDRGLFDPARGETTELEGSGLGE